MTGDSVLDVDGLPMDEVGPWAKEKHDRLRNYIAASAGARKKFLSLADAASSKRVTRVGGATYIDLFCGTGRSLITETGERIDGSPLIAHHRGVASKAPFTSIHIADLDAQRCAAAHTRLQSLGANVTHRVGAAADTVRTIVRAANPYGLHFAFLDPYNLQDLPFSVIQELSTLSRIDMLIHVSLQDLQRNLDRYLHSESDLLEAFAPGWRSAIDVHQSLERIRADLFQYWKQKISALGVRLSDGVELVRGSKNQRLYWLAFVSRSDLADSLWEKIRKIDKQRDLFS